MEGPKAHEFREFAKNRGKWKKKMKLITEFKTSFTTEKKTT